MTSSTPCASRPTATGCAPPPGPSLRSGIWRARTWLRSSSPRFPAALATSNPFHHSACPWPGPLTVKLSSLVTLTMSSVSGKLPSPHTKWRVRCCYNNVHLFAFTIVIHLPPSVCKCGEKIRNEEDLSFLGLSKSFFAAHTFFLAFCGKLHWLNKKIENW